MNNAIATASRPRICGHSWVTMWMRWSKPSASIAASTASWIEATAPEWPRAKAIRSWLASSTAATRARRFATARSSKLITFPMGEKLTRTRLRSDAENPAHSPLPLDGVGWVGVESMKDSALPRSPPLPCPSPSRGGGSSADRLSRLLPIGEEGLQATIGQRVLEELADDRRGGRHDVGADQGGLEDVDRVADGGDQDLGSKVVIVVDLTDLGDDLHAIEAGIVVAADERRNEGGAGLGGE